MDENKITDQEKQELSAMLEREFKGADPVIANRPLSDEELGTQNANTNTSVTDTASSAASTDTNSADTNKSAAASTDANAQQLDINGYLKTNFETENPDEIKGWREKAKQYEALSQEYTSLKDKPPVSPYKSEFGKIADELFAQGVQPQTIARFNGINLETMSDADVLKLQLEVKNPKLETSKIEAVLNERYGVADDLLTEGQKAERELKLIEDATNARESLKHHISKAFSPASNEPDPVIVRQEQERGTFWKENGFKQVKQDVFTITENGKMKVQGLKGLEEVEHNFKYEAPTEVKQTVLKELEAAVLNPANAGYFTNTEEGLKNANAFIEARFLALDGKNILKKQQEYVAERESKLHEHYAKLMHNPQNRNTTTPASPTTSSDVNDKAQDYINKNG